MSNRLINILINLKCCCLASLNPLTVILRWFLHKAAWVILLCNTITTSLASVFRGKWKKMLLASVVFIQHGTALSSKWLRTKRSKEANISVSRSTFVLNADEDLKCPAAWVECKYCAKVVWRLKNVMRIDWFWAQAWPTRIVPSLKGPMNINVFPLETFYAARGPYHNALTPAM